MLRKTADALAVVFHPVFMGTAMLLIFAAKRYELPLSSFWYAAVLILFFGLIIPVAGAYFPNKDIHLKHRNQRFLPLIISFISHIILYFLLKPVYSGKTLMIGIILLSINLLVLLLFTLFVKASMHANAIAIILSVFFIAYAIISILNPVPLAFYIIISCLSIFFGLVIWQRLVSKAHTPKELVAGFVSGLISVGLMLFYIDIFGY